MEPMNLGSPVGSPSSPPTSPYLPSFLMGDPLSGVTLNPKSPVRLGRHVSFSGTPTLSPQSGTVTPPRAARGPVRDATWRASEKPNGPPTRGLYDYCVEPASVYSPQDSSFASANQSHLSHQTSSTTPATADPAACNWVTVFGFPPASASVILSQLSHYGNIIDTRSTRSGNWVHVRYQTRAEARRALSHNAKVFGNSIMVGIVPCTDPDILSEAQQLGKENVNELSMLSTVGHPSTSVTATPNRSINLGQSYASPLNATYTSPGSASYGNTSYGNTSYGTPSRNVRPLGQAYRNAQYASEVQMMRTTPQKSNSIVSKAWEMLGF